MTRIPAFALLIVLFSASSGCVKNVIDRCPSISASATPMVVAGGSIELTAPVYENVSFYKWSGPNGFESTEQNPVIYNVHGYEAGRYTLTVGITDGCTQSVKTDSVIITIPPSPCNPGNNTGEVNGQTISFYYTAGGPRGGSYFITANGSGGDMEIEFPGTEKPVAGVYQIEPLGDNWRRGSVRVRLVANSSNWPASSGKLYVTVTNDKVTATFCGVPVFNQTFYFNATASARVTER